MNGREKLETLGAAVEVARGIRYEDPEVFADVGTEDLMAAGRHLRAVSYSCLEGAKLLERIIGGRQ